MENSMHETTDRDSSDELATWVPIEACSLPTLQQPLRVAEFDHLFATSLRQTQRLDAQRARLVLVGDENLNGTVQGLVAAESSCCSFFAFTVTPGQAHPAEPGQTVELMIEVPAARGEVLEALVSRAEHASRVAL